MIFSFHELDLLSGKPCCQSLGSCRQELDDCCHPEAKPRDLSRIIYGPRKTVTQGKPRGKPFRPRSIGLYLVGRHPIRSNGDGSHGPGLSVTSTSPCPQPPGLAFRSGSQGKPGRGDTKAGAPKRTPCQRAERFGLTPVTGCLIMQD